MMAAAARQAAGMLAATFEAWPEALLALFFAFAWVVFVADVSSLLNVESACAATDFEKAALAFSFAVLSVPETRHLIVAVSSDADTSGACRSRENRSVYWPCSARARVAPAQCACDLGWLTARSVDTSFHCFMSVVMSCVSWPV